MRSAHVACWEQSTGARRVWLSCVGNAWGDDGGCRRARECLACKRPCAWLPCLGHAHDHLTFAAWP